MSKTFNKLSEFWNDYRSTSLTFRTWNRRIRVIQCIISKLLIKKGL